MPKVSAQIEPCPHIEIVNVQINNVQNLINLRSVDIGTDELAQITNLLTEVEKIISNQK